MFFVQAANESDFGLNTNPFIFDSEPENLNYVAPEIIPKNNIITNNTLDNQISIEKKCDEIGQEMFESDEMNTEVIKIEEKNSFISEVKNISLPQPLQPSLLKIDSPPRPPMSSKRLPIQTEVNSDEHINLTNDIVNNHQPIVNDLLGEFETNIDTSITSIQNPTKQLSFDILSDDINHCKNPSTTPSPSMITGTYMAGEKC